ncbi:kinase-like domain-containing protein [Amanita rubescens]|nr:kinase-like domain-containing protein [Amanita rubescens]
MKVYADAEVQALLDPQLRSNTSPLSSLLTILREKKPESPIGCVLNVATIDLARSLLTTKNYVNSALQLTSESDTELLLDFMLYLLCSGHLSCSEVPDANRRARRLMLKMIIKTPVIPSSLFVKGINAKVDYDYVGRGGFGFVFKGELGGAAVALKLLYKTRHNDDFCREALMWRSLNHERVLPFLGIFEDEGASRMFLVSPYMKNGTLSQWRKKTGHSTSEIQRLILEVAEGIQYIHSEGIVHGDLRGDNVLLDSHFHAQVADFGLTRHSEATVTQSGALHYNFAAPELLGNWDEEEDVSESDDDGQLTARTQKSDVYAFGCLYYEVSAPVVGLPFVGLDAQRIQIVKLVSRGKRPPRLDKPPLSDRAWKLIKRCWVKEAVRRPAMEDIVEKIMAWRSA